MDDLSARVDRLERLVDDLYARLGAPVADHRAPGWQDDGGVSGDVRALVSRGDKLGAIKLYRQQTGCDLRTAKGAIEAL